MPIREVDPPVPEWQRALILGWLRALVEVARTEAAARDALAELLRVAEGGGAWNSMHSTSTS